MDELREELERAHEHFLKTGEYCWLAEISYLIHEQQYKE